MHPGRPHSEDDAEGGEEDGSSPGVEENPCGAQGHSRAPSATCGEGPGSAGTGRTTPAPPGTPPGTPTCSKDDRRTVAGSVASGQVIEEVENSLRGRCRIELY